MNHCTRCNDPDCPFNSVRLPPRPVETTYRLISREDIDEHGYIQDGDENGYIRRNRGRGRLLDPPVVPRGRGRGRMLERRNSPRGHDWNLMAPVEWPVDLYGRVIRGPVFGPPISEEEDCKRVRRPTSLQELFPAEEETIHDVHAEDKDNACLICTENKACCVALNCMHMNVCIRCAYMLGKEIPLAKCPLCRKDMTGGMKRVLM